MLLEFGARNFYSFKEGFQMSLRLGKTCPNSASQGKSFTNIVAIKGGNASGKTNIIKALGFLKIFITNSFLKLKPDQKIDIHSFFDNQKSISLYAIFLDKGIEYKYEVALISEKVISETLSKKDTRWNIIIKRELDILTKVSTEFQALQQIKINRSNASIISIAQQYNIKEILPIYSLFDNIHTNVYPPGRLDDKEALPDYGTISKIYKENQKVLDFVTNFLKESDTGIDNIKIMNRTDKETREVRYFPIFDYAVNEKKNYLSFHDQSNGVQSLYLRLVLYFAALESGSVLALDEFDIHLHPDILPKILGLFENTATNPKNAQLILTTHNDDIMDRLGKYKTILVNKKDNESFLYRLDEVIGDIIRNDRPISPVYRANKIGGKPNIHYG